MAYGKKYTMSFERTFLTKIGQTSKKYEFNLYQDGYAGTDIELDNMGDTPLVVKYDGNKDDVFEPILPTSLDFQLVSTPERTFNDIVEATDSEFFAEVVEKSNPNEVVIGYQYTSDMYIDVFDTPQYPNGSPAYIQNYYLTVDGVTRNLADNVDNKLEIAYNNSATFEQNKEDILTFLIDYLNERYGDLGLIFSNEGDIIRIISNDLHEVEAPGTYDIGNSKITVILNGIRSTPLPLTTMQGGDEVIFRGFVSPAGITRPYMYSDHILNVTAVDGLNLLKDVQFLRSWADLKRENPFYSIARVLNFRHSITNLGADNIFTDFDLKASVTSDATLENYVISLLEWNPSYFAVVDFSVINGNNDGLYRWGMKGAWRIKIKNNAGFDQTKQMLSSIVTAPTTDPNFDRTALFALILEQIKTELNQWFADLLPTYPVTAGLTCTDNYNIKHVNGDIEVYSFEQSLPFDNNNFIWTVQRFTIEYSSAEGGFDANTITKLTHNNNAFFSTTQYEALERILRQYGLRLYYYKGWVLERVANIKNTSRTFFKYQTDTSENILFANVGNIINRRVERDEFSIVKGMNEGRIASWKDFSFKNSYLSNIPPFKVDFKDSDFYIENGTLYNRFAREFGARAVKYNAGKDNIIGIEPIAGNANPFVSFQNFEFNTVNFKNYSSISIEFGRLFGYTARVSIYIGGYFLDGDGNLVTTPTLIPVSLDDTSPKLEITPIVFQDFLPISTATEPIFINIYCADDGTKYATTYVRKISFQNTLSDSGLEIYTNINPNNRKRVSEYTRYFSDYGLNAVEQTTDVLLLQPRSITALFKGILALEETPTKLWINGSGVVGELNQLIAGEYAAQFSANRMHINGTIREFVEPTTVLSLAYGKICAFMGGDFDLKRNIINADWVEVGQSAYIVSLAALPDIQVVKGDVVNLPQTVEATWSDGSKTQETIIWDMFTADRVGQFTVKGVVLGQYPVATNVIVVFDSTGDTEPRIVTGGEYRIISNNDYRVVHKLQGGQIVSYEPLADVSVFIDGTPTLPTSTIVIYQTGTTGNANIVWGTYSTAVAGTFVINGVATDADGLTINVVVNLIVTQMADIDILRAIRAANLTSQLSTLWLDSEDPYTQWEGVTWNVAKTKVTQLFVASKGITNATYIGKLTGMTRLDVSYNNIGSIDVSLMPNLIDLYCDQCGLSALNLSNNPFLGDLFCSLNPLLTTLDLSANIRLDTIGCASGNLANLTLPNTYAFLTTLIINNNKIISIPTLTTKGSINSYNFTNNKMQPTETSRIIALGFSSTYVLPQNL